MKLVRKVAGTRGDARRPYVLRVANGRREREVSYLPRGAGKVTVQQIEIGAAAGEREACARALAGARR